MELQKAIDAARTYQDIADRSGNQDFQKKADESVKSAPLYRTLQQAETRLEQSCEAGANKIRESIRAATESALKDAKDISEAKDGWGLGAGELQKMPIQQKPELAKRLQTRKFKGKFVKGKLMLYKSNDYFRRFKKSSLFRPACLIISINVPGSTSL